MTSILSGATLSLNQVSAGTGTFTSAIVNLLDTITATFQTLTTNIANITTAVIDSLTATTANIATIISNTLTTRDITSTGTANFNNANFSGNVVFNALPILPLTQGSLLVGSNTNTASELTAGGTGQILVILNGTPVWTDAANIAPVVSMFGRTGAVIAQSGDYNTSQVTESGNLYFTPARARATLSSTGAITYDSLTGLIGWNGTTDSVAE